MNEAGNACFVALGPQMPALLGLLCCLRRPWGTVVCQTCIIHRQEPVCFGYYNPRVSNRGLTRKDNLKLARAFEWRRNIHQPGVWILPWDTSFCTPRMCSTDMIWILKHDDRTIVRMFAENRFVFFWRAKSICFPSACPTALGLP